MESLKLESLKCLRENSEVFNSEFSVLGIVQNGKPGVKILGKLTLQGFSVFRELRVFDLAERFRGLEQRLGGFYKAERGLKNFGGAWEEAEKARRGWKR